MSLSDISRGWSLLLLKVEKASRRAARTKNRELRSCLWLNGHDPATVDALLESALLGKNRRTKLAAIGTLLASTDALAEACSVIADERNNSSAQREQQQPKPLSSTAVIVARMNTEKLLLRRLAVSLAERFVPLLTSIALGVTPPPPRPPPLPSGGATGTEVQVTSANTALASGAGEKSPPSLPPAAAASTAAGRPVALTCFAAECALAMTSVAALVASSSPDPGIATTTTAAAAAAAALGGDDKGEGSSGERATAATVPADQVNDVLDQETLEEIPTLRIRGGPAGESTKKKEEKEEEEEKEEKFRTEEEHNRRRAVGVLSAVFPVSTIPLLSLAEVWLGGGEEEASAAVAAGFPASRDGGNGSYCDGLDMRAEWAIDSVGESGGRGEGSAHGFGGSSVGGAAMTAAAVGYGGGKGLVVQAVRDLAVLIASAVDVSLELQEQQAESRRALARDGLEGSFPAQREQPALAGLIEHAAWHLGRTVSTILRNRRWPTAALTAGGARSSATGSRRSDLMGSIRELEACDPRGFEMAGVEPPQGLEEGRWLALRKLCLCLGGARVKDWLDGSYGPAGGIESRRATKGGGGVHGMGGGDYGSGSGLAGALQETLVRSLWRSKPEAQKLGASALVMVMSTVLRERPDVPSSEGRAGEEAAVDVGPLLGLLVQEGGDAASDAARAVLTGLAVERPLLVIPEVLRAAREAAAGAPRVSSVPDPGRPATARVNLTVILADTLAKTGGGSQFPSLCGDCRQDLRKGSEGGVSPLDAVREYLVHCLGSDDLRLRKTATRGLVSLDPGWVIPRLCRWLAEEEGAAPKEQQQQEEEERLRQGAEEVIDGVGGAGWGSHGRSAALQAMGEIIVGGRDPADALSALLDSLRNVAALAGNPSLGADGGGGGGGDADGNVDGGGGGGGGTGGREKGRELVGRVMKSLSLWARRLKTRSDNRDAARAFWLQQAGAGSSAGAPPCPAPAAPPAAPAGAPASSAPAAAGAITASSSSSSDVAATEVEVENEAAEEGAILPWKATPPTLFGECLEVAAIKAFAAPRDPLPLRFFAVLAAAAAATAAAAGGAATAAATQMASPPPTRAGIENAPVCMPGSLGADKYATEEASSSSPEESLVAQFGAKAEDTAAAAAAAAEAAGRRVAGGRGETRGGERRCGSALAGVLELVRRRMNGQLRVSEELLRDESEEASEVVKELLFCRLTPLLVVHALPPAALVAEDELALRTAAEWRNRWGVSGEGMEGFCPRSSQVSEDGQEGGCSRAGVRGSLEEIHGLLLERIERVFEYHQVQKLSAETSGRLPPRLVLPEVVSRLHRFCEWAELSEEESRENSEQLLAKKPGDGDRAPQATLASRALFTACHAISSHGSLLGPWVGMLLLATVRIALLPARSLGDDVEKVQHRAVECLSVLMQASVSPVTAAAAAAPDAAAPASTTATATATSVAAFSDPSISSETPQSETAVSVTIIKLMEIGEVPALMASIAVEGVLPEGFRRGVGGGGWLEGALSQARRREREEEETGRGAGAGEGEGDSALLPKQLRMCFANSVVLAARQCDQEFLPALCVRGNTLGMFLRGASRGNGLLRAACLQALFALVYRTKNVFGDGGAGGTRTRSHSGASCTCDDVMQVACDALAQDQHPEVRNSGLKLLLSMVTMGASSSGAAAVASSPPHPGGKPKATAALLNGGGTKADIMSPAVVSRAKRLLVGVSNIDESVHVRKLAEQALAALGGTPL
ncbi:unnamed protein product [Pylaiella littoralis]